MMTSEPFSKFHALSRKNQIPTTILIFLFFLSISSNASVPKTEIKPVTFFEEALKPSAKLEPELKLLKASYESYHKKRFEDAIQTAKKIPNSSSFMDYRDWLISQSYFEQSEKYLSQKQYKSARYVNQLATEKLFSIQRSHPFSPLIEMIPEQLARADVTIGQSHFGESKWSLSQTFFENAFARLDAEKKLPDTSLATLKSYSTACSKKTGQYCESWLGKFLRIFPTRSAEAQAIRKFATTIAKRAKYPYYAKSPHRRYRGEDRDELAFEEAINHFEKRQFKEAKPLLEEFLKTYPRSKLRERALFWLAQTDKELGNKEKSQETLAELVKTSPLSYFGLVAAQQTKMSLSSRFHTSLPKAQESDRSLQPQDKIRLKRTKELLKANLVEFARFELNGFKTLHRFSGNFLVYLAMLNKKADNNRSVFTIVHHLMDRSFKGAHSSYVLSLLYPKTYESLIEKHTAPHQIDKFLLMSLMKQESAFDAKARSHAGALGLLQIMPTTAVGVEPNLSLAKLKIANENIRIGARYFGGLLRRFKGNVVLSLAAYNAGPGAVSKWMRQSRPTTSMIEFIESIPYDETRHYVESIIRNYAWYQRQERGPKSKFVLHALWKPLSESR